MVKLKTKLDNITLKNPVLLASGTCGVAGKEFKPYFNLQDLGGLVTKSVSIKPRTGNPTPRVVEVQNGCGMLNSIGLQNPGADHFIKEELPYLRENNVTTFINIVGESMEDYLSAVEKVKDEKGITAIELNLSCPNVDGGLDFSQDPNKAFELIDEVKKITGLPIFSKLSPNITDITKIAKAAIDAGSTGLSLINTVIGLAIDAKTRRPILPRAIGGYSGPGIKPIALRMVWQTHKMFPDTPIIGIGGIHNGIDAIEFILAGASAVQIGTASFKNPKASINVVNEIEDYLTKNKIGSISELIGEAQLKKKVSLS